MRVKALDQFNDLTEKVMRKKGDEFEVTEKRFEKINSTSFGVLIEIIKENGSDTKTDLKNKPKQGNKIN